MLKVVIIISDIDKRNKILEKREKKELLNYAKLITTGSDIYIIDPIDMCEQKLKEMCSINYPISKKIECKKINIFELSKNIDFNNGDTIILPYFNNTKYWIKLVIGNKEEFMNYMFKKGYFNSFSIICPNKKVIYDIELGELEYEIRICNY